MSMACPRCGNKIDLSDLVEVEEKLNRVDKWLDKMWDLPQSSLLSDELNTLYKILSSKQAMKLNENRYWVLQEFIYNLNDETRWPAKYYKDVIDFFVSLSDSDEIPESIQYTKCCHGFSTSSGKKEEV